VGQGLETSLVRLVADFIMEREARRLEKTVVGDKTPNVNAGEAVRRMSAVYPDARLIYIVRDGRDAALSHRFQHFIDQPHLLTRQDLRIRKNFILDNRPYLEGKRSIFTRQALRNEAFSWAKNVTETHALGQELLGERYTCLRYEDLLASPHDHMRRVWAFLQVPPDYPGMEDQVREKMEYNPGAEAQLEKEGELARNLRRGIQGNWCEFFTARDRQIFKQDAGKALMDWNYEKDLEW
jgi:hypothetical protein